MGTTDSEKKKSHSHKNKSRPPPPTNPPPEFNQEHISKHLNDKPSKPEPIKTEVISVASKTVENSWVNSQDQHSYHQPHFQHHQQQQRYPNHHDSREQLPSRHHQDIHHDRHYDERSSEYRPQHDHSYGYPPYNQDHHHHHRRGGGDPYERQQAPPPINHISNQETTTNQPYPNAWGSKEQPRLQYRVQQQHHHHHHQQQRSHHQSARAPPPTFEFNHQNAPILADGGYSQPHRRAPEHHQQHQSQRRAPPAMAPPPTSFQPYVDSDFMEEKEPNNFHKMKKKNNQKQNQNQNNDLLIGENRPSKVSVSVTSLARSSYDSSKAVPASPICPENMEENDSHKNDKSSSKRHQEEKHDEIEEIEQLEMNHDKNENNKKSFNQKMDEAAIPTYEGKENNTNNNNQNENNVSKEQKMKKNMSIPTNQLKHLQSPTNHVSSSPPLSDQTENNEVPRNLLTELQSKRKYENNRLYKQNKDSEKQKMKEVKKREEDKEAEQKKSMNVYNKCLIMRDRKGMKNRMLPTYNLYSQDNVSPGSSPELIMIAVKQPGRTSCYRFFDMRKRTYKNKEKLDKNASHYIGKLRGNYNRDEYSVYGKNKIIKGAVIYDKADILSQLMESALPRKMCMLLPLDIINRIKLKQLETMLSSSSSSSLNNNINNTNNMIKDDDDDEETKSDEDGNDSSFESHEKQQPSSPSSSTTSSSENDDEKPFRDMTPEERLAKMMNHVENVNGGGGGGGFDLSSTSVCSSDSSVHSTQKKKSKTSSSSSSSSVSEDVNALSSVKPNIVKGKVGNEKSKSYLQLTSKEPVFEKNSYRLNFHGRVKLPSVKNYQLVR